jgi:hypothetical protein
VGNQQDLPTATGPSLVITDSERMTDWALVDSAERPLDDVPSEVTTAAEDAASGQLVYLTEDGRQLAAIVPVEVALELERRGLDAFLEFLEDFADAEAARDALAEAAEPVPWEEVKAEAEGLIG